MLEAEVVAAKEEAEVIVTRVKSCNWEYEQGGDCEDLKMWR